jgi:hypothetical protein
VGGVKGMVVQGRKYKLGLPRPGELRFDIPCELVNSQETAALECTVGGVKGMVVKGRKSKLGLPHPGELQNTRSPARYAFRSAAAVSKGPCAAAPQLRGRNVHQHSRSCSRHPHKQSCVLQSET